MGFLIPNDDYEEMDKKLLQASSISSLLLCNGQSIDGFESTHSIIINALWTVEDLIDDTQKILRTSKLVPKK